MPPKGARQQQRGGAAPRQPGDQAPGRRGSDAEAAQVAANEHCLRQYGSGSTGGTPRRLSLRADEVWIVPVVLTSPGYGAVGEVGVVAVEAGTGAVVGATPRDEVRAAGTRLAREKRHELDAAFRRARTT